MKSVKKFLLKILLVIELVIYVAYYHFEKLLFFGIIALDQYTKARVLATMTLGETIPIFQGSLHITYVSNPGAAFGIFAYQRTLFIFLGVLLILGAVIYYPRWLRAEKILRYGVLSSLAGAIANMIDRVKDGFVVDFIDFRRGLPVFNIADMAIVIGMMAIVYVVMIKAEKDSDVEEVR